MWALPSSSSKLLLVVHAGAPLSHEQTTCGVDPQYMGGMPTIGGQTILAFDPSISNSVDHMNHRVHVSLNAVVCLLLTGDQALLDTIRSDPEARLRSERRYTHRQLLEYVEVHSVILPFRGTMRTSCVHVQVDAPLWQLIVEIGDEKKG